MPVFASYQNIILFNMSLEKICLKDYIRYPTTIIAAIIIFAHFCAIIYTTFKAFCHKDTVNSRIGKWLLKLLEQLLQCFYIFQALSFDWWDDRPESYYKQDSSKYLRLYIPGSVLYIIIFCEIYSMFWILYEGPARAYVRESTGFIFSLKIYVLYFYVDRVLAVGDGREKVLFTGISYLILMILNMLLVLFDFPYRYMTQKEIQRLEQNIQSSFEGHGKKNHSTVGFDDNKDSKRAAILINRDTGIADPNQLKSLNSNGDKTNRTISETDESILLGKDPWGDIRIVQTHLFLIMIPLLLGRILQLLLGQNISITGMIVRDRFTDDYFFTKHHDKTRLLFCYQAMFADSYKPAIFQSEETKNEYNYHPGSFDLYMNIFFIFHGMYMFLSACGCTSLFFDWCVGPVKKVRRTGRADSMLVQNKNKYNPYVNRDQKNSWDFQGRKDEVFK